jgi:Ca-activated chloride channel family protein
MNQEPRKQAPSMIGFAEIVAVGALVATVSIAALNSTGTSVNGLIQKVASSLSTVGGGGPYVASQFTPAPAAQPPAQATPPPEEHAFARAEVERLSTFSIDVDTASYSNVRRYLTNNGLPPADEVRVEELVNYFPYRYPAPEGNDPLTVHAEVTACPWRAGNRLVRIGLTARKPDWSKRPRVNLVFLVDVSGSMAEPKKLPLVKQTLRELLPQLGEADRVSLVTYAGYSCVALPPTPADRRDPIVEAIDGLGAGGSTNGAGGIVEAYKLARQTFIEGGINRVVLATDGDFNVGVTSQSELTELIKREAKDGVELTVLGYGMSTYRDGTLETLAQHGNGNYAYIDAIAEARKVLSEQIGGTLWTVARDVKVQVEMDPAAVKSWRQIGYENRAMAHVEFRDDAKDACELGAGHTVTALYEIEPAGKQDAKILTVRARFKEPGAFRARELEFPLFDRGAAFAAATPELRFAAAVAGFGMILRASPHRGTITLGEVAAIAREHERVDAHRAEFLTLVARAADLGADPRSHASLR